MGSAQRACGQSPAAAAASEFGSREVDMPMTVHLQGRWSCPGIVDVWRAARAALLLAALLVPTCLHAADVGSIRGVVHDSQHLPIAKADVTLRSSTSDWVQRTATDARGEFAFMTVPLGDYVVTVSHGDFAPAAQALTVASGSSPIAHLQLAKGPALDAIMVTAAAE